VFWGIWRNGFIGSNRSPLHTGMTTNDYSVQKLKHLLRIAMNNMITTSPKMSAVHTIIPFPMMVNTLRVDGICVALQCSVDELDELITIKCTILLVVEVSRDVWIDVVDNMIQFHGFYPQDITDISDFLDRSSIHMNTSIKKFILSSNLLQYNPLLGSLQQPTISFTKLVNAFKVSQSLMEQMDDVSNLHLCLCSVCYILTDVRPLGCHHHICLKCILKLQEKKCPQCRKDFQYICNNKLDLWNNHRPNFNWMDKNTPL